MLGLFILVLFLLVVCGLGAYVLQMICGIVANEEVELFPCGLTTFLATLLSIGAMIASALVIVSTGLPPVTHWLLSFVFAAIINGVLTRAIIKLDWKPSFIIGACLHVCIMIVWMFFGTMAR